MTIVERIISYLERDGSADYVSKKQALELMEILIVYEKRQLEQAFTSGYLELWTDFEKYYESISKREQDRANVHLDSDNK